MIRFFLIGKCILMLKFCFMISYHLRFYGSSKTYHSVVYKQGEESAWPCLGFAARNEDFREVKLL